MCDLRDTPSATHLPHGRGPRSLDRQGSRTALPSVQPRHRATERRSTERGPRFKVFESEQGIKKGAEAPLVISLTSFVFLSHILYPFLSHILEMSVLPPFRLRMPKGLALILLLALL